MVKKSRTARGIAQHLESLKQAGITHLPKAGKTTARPRKAQPAQEAPTAAKKPLKKADPTEALKSVQTQVAECRLCKELANTRTQTVFGAGNPQPRLVFMGEAPGADEDRQGIPFIGQAGQLLTRIIENVCGMTREDVYILNTLKCRPPGNRKPEPQEVTHCRPYLDAQLKILQPEFICCLGAVAAQCLLDTPQSIGKLRGRIWNYEGIKVLCTYHPAYLLRNPAAKRDVWEDMIFLLGEMGIEPKQRPE